MKTGVQESCKYLNELDSGFRRNDGKMKIQTFYEIIKNSLSKIFSGSKETARLSARDYFDSGFAETIGRERESCLKREWTT